MSFRAGIILSGIAASAFALSLASPALHAHNTIMDRTELSTNVHFEDLNLDQPSDVATLYRRISSAAARVCGSRATTWIYYTLTEYQSCVTDTMQQAVARVNRPQLTSYYQRLTPPGLITIAKQ